MPGLVRPQFRGAMSGSQSSMLYKGSILSRRLATRFVFSVLILIVWLPPSFAQTTLQTGAQSLIGVGAPPPDILITRLPARDPNAIAVDGWLLYPSVRIYSLYTDNFFQTPQNPLSVGGLGVTPSMTAVWSNGIHTTTLYGNLDRQDYPTDNGINTLDGRAGFTQKYEAMRDLILTFNGNYAHQTLATGLQNSIQTPTAAPVLPNLSPSGQPVGQITAPPGSTFPLLVNPSNQYTGTFTVDKIFSRAAISLSGSVNRTEFENQSIQPNFSSRTLTENAAAWIGPLVYAYSNGSVTTTAEDAITGPNISSPSISITSYRVIGGLGTRPSELFLGSVYFGHQGSESGGATAEGNVYGGRLSYYPTAALTFTGTVDRTVNIASQPFASNLALTLPGLTAVQLPLGVSAITSSVGLSANYKITQQWFVNCQLGYTRTDFISTPERDNSWIVDATLRYDVWRNMSILWEYRYTTLLSNVPLLSFSSNYGTVGATYRF